MPKKIGNINPGIDCVVLKHYSHVIVTSATPNYFTEVKNKSPCAMLLLPISQLFYIR